VGSQGFSLLLRIHSTERFCETSADDEDIALLEFDALILCDLLDLGDLDSMGIKLAELNTILVRPCLVVNENTSSNNTSPGMPIYVAFSAINRKFRNRQVTYDSGLEAIVPCLPLQSSA
jgi:hypothetical protein